MGNAQFYLKNGKEIITASGNQIKVWDLERVKHLESIPSNEFERNYISVDNREENIAVLRDYYIEIYNIKTKESYVKLPVRSNCISFSTRENNIAISHRNTNIVEIIDVKTSSVIQKLEGHTNDLNSIAFSPDGQYIVTGSDDFSIKIWNSETGNIVRTIKADNSSVNHVYVTPDSKNIISTHGNIRTKIWNIEDGKLLFDFVAHQQKITSISIASKDRLIATASHDGTIKVWNLNSGNLMKTIITQSPLSCITFSPNGEQIASGSVNGEIKIWNLNRNAVDLVLFGHRRFVDNLIYSSDGQKLFSGGSGGVSIWDLNFENLISEWLAGDFSLDLNLPLLLKYNLQNLMNLKPENENLLIDTKEVWQIKAFADLDASEAVGSNILERVEPLYARADRLYAAALDLQDEELIRMDYAKMLRNWASVYESEGQNEKAEELMKKADSLWKQ